MYPIIYCCHNAIIDDDTIIIMPVAKPHIIDIYKKVTDCNVIDILFYHLLIIIFAKRKGKAFSVFSMTKPQFNC